MGLFSREITKDGIKVKMGTPVTADLKGIEGTRQGRVNSLNPLSIKLTNGKAYEVLTLFAVIDKW